MYNVLIVDDAAEIRTGLRLKLDWAGHGFAIAGEAANGSQALSALGERPIQLLITDVRMPVMDGLELIRECAGRYPRMKLVVLSGYDEFPYVQASLRSGAKDYLLKPVLTDELASVLAKARKELDAEREEALLGLLGADAASRELREQARMLGLASWGEGGRACRFASVEMRVPPGRLGVRSERPDLLRLAFRLLVRELAERRGGELLAFHDPAWPDMMHLLVGPAERGPEAEEGDGFLGELRAAVRELLGVEAVVGIGEPVDRWELWREGYQSALYAWSRSRLSAASQILFDDSEDMPGGWPDATEKRWRLAFENGSVVQLRQLVAELEEAARSDTVGSFSFLLMRICLLLYELARRYDIRSGEVQRGIWQFFHHGRDGEAADQKLLRVRTIAFELLALLRDAGRSGGEEAVAAIRDYVRARYGEDISLSAIARQFHYSPAYLSDLFRKRTGATFSDYVLKIRMERASELLAQQTLKLADIAELTGFANANYFSSVFKSFYGVSPNAYRRSLAGPS